MRYCIFGAISHQSPNRSGAMHRGDKHVHVLIVVPNAVLGAVMATAVDNCITLILIVEKRGAGAIVWRNPTETKIGSLIEAIREADVVVASHTDDAVAWIRELTFDKPVIRVVEDNELCAASVPLSMFRRMWPELAEAVRNS